MDATIAAISTAMSASGIGIVRISGEKIFVQSSAIPFIMDLSMMEKKL